MIFFAPGGPGEAGYAAGVIFSRSKDRSGDRTIRDCGPAIAKFWRWWPGVRVRVERAITDGWDDALVGEIATKVEAIHPHLQWELTRGSASGHLPGAGLGAG